MVVFSAWRMSPYWSSCAFIGLFANAIQPKTRKAWSYFPGPALSLILSRMREYMSSRSVGKVETAFFSSCILVASSRIINTSRAQRNMPIGKVSIVCYGQKNGKEQAEYFKSEYSPSAFSTSLSSMMSNTTLFTRP
jgi:hypothetical protein